MSLRWRRNRRLKCECGGYHFPHRVHSGLCHTSPTRDIHLALRTGSKGDVIEARLVHAERTAAASFAPCPF